MACIATDGQDILQNICVMGCQGYFTLTPAVTVRTVSIIDEY